MRESCIDCVIKHVQAASIFVHESKFGYPNHCYDAIGELYHAECELEGLSMRVAQEIRDIRKRIETEEGADFNVAELRAKVLGIEDTADFAEVRAEILAEHEAMVPAEGTELSDEKIYEDHSRCPECGEDTPVTNMAGGYICLACRFTFRTTPSPFDKHGNYIKMVPPEDKPDD